VVRREGLVGWGLEVGEGDEGVVRREGLVGWGLEVGEGDGGVG
jgi:hypothetical protein